jgi:hypothetical protein
LESIVNIFFDVLGQHDAFWWFDLAIIVAGTGFVGCVVFEIILAAIEWREAKTRILNK